MNIKRDLSIIAVLVLIIFSAAMFKVGTGMLGQNQGTPAPVGPATDGPAPIGNEVPSKPKPTEGTVTLKLNESASIGNVVVTPRDVTEDSRCAEGVQCVWAGTVKVRTDITSGLGTAKETIEIGKFITTEAEKITLVSVTPAPKAGTQIADADYRITYKIEKRPLSEINPGVPTGKCYIGGCSGQICSDQEGMSSTCEYRESYACYKTAKCERQASGQCGWTQTPALAACLSNAQ